MSKSEIRDVLRVKLFGLKGEEGLSIASFVGLPPRLFERRHIFIFSLFPPEPSAFLHCQ